MDDNSRSRLIKSLNAAIVGDALPNVTGERTNYFNDATGTLYCTVNGVKIPETDIRNAVIYFKQAIMSMNEINGVDGISLKQHYCELAIQSLEQVLGKNMI